MTVSNIEVQQIANIASLEAPLRNTRLHGHVLRMDDNRLPKQVLYGELKTGKTHRWWPETL